MDNYISGFLYKEIFRNEINGYMVGLFKVKESSTGYSGIINITGILPSLSKDKEYILYGDMAVHPKYGKQFNVTSYEIKIPSKKDELITFFSSSLFPIGVKTAEKIVELIPDDTINKILEDKTVLEGIPRLTLEKIDVIYNTLKDYENTSSIVLKLTNIGFDISDSLNFLNKYDNKILDTVNNNIYSLIDSDCMSFKKIDEIALNMGIDPLDDNRIKALIIYNMKDICFRRGDTYLLKEDIIVSVTSYVSITSDKLDYLLLKLIQDKKIVIDNDRYYLKELYDSEIYIMERLCFLNDMPVNKFIKTSKYIDNSSIIYDEMQKKAIYEGVNNNITIITGGPGTGKTTIIKAIVNILKEVKKIKDIDIALLSPTGRASKKLMEVTGINASTIHKYLGWDKDNNKFNVNEYNPRKEKYIIVDEVSMIDTILMASLLKGIKRDAKVILVGDYYQLPSVSEGQVLKDLIDSECLPVIKLNKIYRQTEESYILNLAYDIKEKNIGPDLFIKREDYTFLSSNEDNTLSIIKEVVKKAISKGYTDKNIQVLAPMYKKLNGIDNLNVMLQSLFNPKSENKKEFTYGDIIYRENDKVLQLVNDPDNNIYNGDIGYIESIIISSDKKIVNEVNINFDGNIVTYTKDKFLNFRHGYAISIHKAQGSEFDMVIMPVISSFKVMLYNKLIYTGVTRAKNSLILVGEDSSFIYAINNDFDNERRTTLKDFIINNYSIKN